MRSLLVFLTICASLSPLFTFAHLWQLKEWRWDRLREHLRHHGWLRQLFGISRPTLVLFFLILTQIFNFQFSIFNFIGLSILTGINILQIALHRQPFPVWTKKALTLVITSLFFTAILSYLLPPTSYLLLLPLLQPLALTLALTLFSPLDSLLKHRILKRAKNLRFQYPHLTVIGITGSAGKTTTKELLAHILHDLNPLVTPNHVNSELGVANWLIKTLSHKKNLSERVGLVGPTRGGPHEGKGELMRGKSLGFPLMIVEMGAYKKGEIQTLCDIVKPSIGIITSIGTQHMALFGSQKNLLEAKAELLDALPKNGHAFINADNAPSIALIARSPCPCTTVGTGEPAKMRATHVEEKPDGLHFKIDAVSFFVPLHGLHNITNILLAIAAAEFLGLSREDTTQKLRTFEPPLKTFSLREERGITILDNTHNLSPESFRESIRWTKSQQVHPKTLLTSGMIELGDSQDAIHEELGKLCKDIFDRVIFLDKRSAKHFAKGFGSTVEIFSSQTKHILKGSLLVCNGRMSPRIIQTLLP